MSCQVQCYWALNWAILRDPGTLTSPLLLGSVFPGAGNSTLPPLHSFFLGVCVGGRGGVCLKTCTPPSTSLDYKANPSLL